MQFHLAEIKSLVHFQLTSQVNIPKFVITKSFIESSSPIKQGMSPNTVGNES
jgi:hypothetical protein